MADKEQGFKISKIKNTSTGKVGHLKIAVFGAAGSGKALANSEMVLTPNGWVENGTLEVGDYVIGSNGEPIKILNVYPQGVQDIYEVKFDDDTTVRCTLDHLWTVKVRGNSGGSTTIMLKEMIERGLLITKEQKDKRYDFPYISTAKRFFIPHSSPIKMDRNDNLKIHPCLLGLLIGDGSMTRDSVEFTNGKRKIINKLIGLLPDDDTVNNNIKLENGAYYVCISRRKMNNDKSETSKALRYYGLIGKKSLDKFIPKEYLNSSIEQREQLLEGLLDTDGSKSRYEYYTSSERLKDDVVELARSLGKFVSVSIREEPKYKLNGETKIGAKAYTIRFRKQKKESYGKGIVSATKIGEEDATCIRVDSEDSLYVTNGYNLTHNSRWSLNGSRDAVVVNLDNGLASIDDGQEMTSLDITGSPTEICVGVKSAYEYVRDNVSDYDLLVFDTYGAYTAALLSYFQEYGDEKSWGMDFSQKLFEAHKQWMELPIDKVFIFHEESLMNDSGVERYTPSVSGGKFKESLPSFYDLVIRFVQDGDDESHGICGDKVSIGKNRYLSRMPEIEGHLFGSNGEFTNFQELRDYIDFQKKKPVKKKQKKGSDEDE